MWSRRSHTKPLHSLEGAAAFCLDRYISISRTEVCECFESGQKQAAIGHDQSAAKAKSFHPYLMILIGHVDGSGTIPGRKDPSSAARYTVIIHHTANCLLPISSLDIGRKIGQRRNIHLADMQPYSCLTTQNDSLRN